MNQQQRKKLLERLSTEIAQLLGNQLYRVLLYGSYARDEERLDSDLDILIILHEELDYAALIRRTSDLVSSLSLENDIVISRAFISKERFENERSPFTLNVQREGIPI